MPLRPLLAAAALAPALAAPAQAGGYVAQRPCVLASHNDPTGLLNQDPAAQNGVIAGIATVATGTTGTLRCWLQLTPYYGAAPGYGYDGLAGATGTGTTVVVVPPTPVMYYPPLGADVYVCALLQGNGTTSVWDDVSGRFVPATGASSARCALSIWVTEPTP
jgi:hypothetical protein